MERGDPGVRRFLELRKRKASYNAHAWNDATHVHACVVIVKLIFVLERACLYLARVESETLSSTVMAIAVQP